MSITEFLEARLTEDEQDAKDRRLGDYFSDDPITDRMFKECAAKRAILDEHELAGEWCVTCEREHPCPTLKIVAGVYSDHSDYNSQWSL